jgi:hypothetical protein
MIYLEMVKVYWNIIIDHILDAEFLINETVWVNDQFLKQCHPRLWNEVWLLDQPNSQI